MNDLRWNGEMDYGWEDLAELIRSTCHRFANTMLETTAFSPNAESREMISDKCMTRFESITYILADIVEQGYHCASEDATAGAQNASKLNGWILLGSLTETTLQMFLAFYLDDYKKTKWHSVRDGVPLILYFVILSIRCLPVATMNLAAGAESSFGRGLTNPPASKVRSPS